MVLNFFLRKQKSFESRPSKNHLHTITLHSKTISYQINTQTIWGTYSAYNNAKIFHTQKNAA